MPIEDRITLSGAPGSPYTRKMLAVLRCRRLPYRFLTSGADGLAGMPRPKVQLLPTFYFPGATGGLEAVTDSTPIIRRLEGEHVGRSVIPSDPALAFLDELIEDYADEWLTKAMFHYRWTYQDDIDKASIILPAWRQYSTPDDTLKPLAKAIGERQIGRLPVVGSNPVTAPVIEESYRRFLEVFEAHLTHQRFILGARPASCDFAVYGQLTQLAHFDPTPAALTLKIAPRVYAWVDVMEDLSGLEPVEADWINLNAVPPTLMALLAEIGRVYPPVMLANAKALLSGAAQVETEVDGRAWIQPPFPYQAKCLTWLRRSHENLSEHDRPRVDEVLRATGCFSLFA
jgi:glutathione S-transferase